VESAPIKVDQTPAAPDIPVRAWSFLPSMADTADGTLGVAYYDFRNGWCDTDQIGWPGNPRIE